MPSFSITELAQELSATVQGDAKAVISGLAPLAQAQAGHLSYLAQSKYRKFLPDTKATAVLVTQKDAVLCPSTALVVENPEAAYARIAKHFKKPYTTPKGVHPSVVLGANVEVEGTVSIGPQCVIGDRVKIGSGTVIHAGTIIGDDVKIGSDCVLHARVTIYPEAVLGDRIILHSGVVLGAEGFGLAQDKGKWVEIPQLGRVIIGNDVSVGANTCIDRGALQDTVIEEGVKLDNLIQVGHNVHIGAHTVVAGTVGIAGSATIGRYCLIGGGTCINGHITIVDRVIVTGMSMVIQSITEPGVYSSGTNVQPNRQWHKSAYHFQHLDDIVKRIKTLERDNE